MFSFSKQVLSALVVSLLAGSAMAQELTTEETKFFETKIRPVLVKECYGCHSNESGNVRGGLRLDTRQLTYVGGSSGPAIVPGDLEESLLYNAITHEDFVMPPKRKLPQNVIDDFRKWIEMGAPDPRRTEIAEIKGSISDADIDEARDSFWAYQSPRLQSPGKIENASWAETPVDRYVAAKWEEAGVPLAPDAEAIQVLRRLCFDLVGLPPSPGQITRFTSDWREGAQLAIGRMVDQLLDQDQFGERWGRHWLDVARYAESTGREVNMTYPHAWRYRDYVIDSFNDDKPFHRFVQQQIAGDLLPASTDQEWSENLVATSFLAMGPKNVNEQNRVQFQADLIDEQIDATTRVFLGTSVACARCHDHKFDAIPQSDYYALAGIFGNATTYFGNPPSEYGNFSTAQMKRTSSLLVLPVDDPNPFDKRYDNRELSELRGEIDAKMGELVETRRNRQGTGADAQNAVRRRLRLTNELMSLSAKLAVVDGDGVPRSYCMGVQDKEAAPKNARLLVRGEIDQPAQEVERGFPRVLCSVDSSVDLDAIGSQGSGRLELARWIGSDRNPLTARVMVNRVWQQLLGQGIVVSTENFGVTGQAPSHPKLLDYLALEFVESDWSIKSLIREIVTSRVYRISSGFNSVAHQQDPDNAMLWRANPRRLDAEAIRDAMLIVSGEIDLDRPRGSEVARAGFQRVRGGFLGDPRENARKALESAGQEMRASMRNRRSSGRPGLGARPGANSRQSGRGLPGMRRAGSGFRGGSGAAQGGDNRAGFEAAVREATRKATSQLDMEDAKYRSVYLPIVRDEEPRSLVVFDLADSSTVTGTRESSNTANQALYMMNNPFVIQQSESFAKRVATRESKLADQIRLAFVLAYGRPPTSYERSATATFFRTFDASSDSNRRRGLALTTFCQSLFASAEFRYID